MFRKTTQGAMKIVVLTEGGQDVGFGHVTRCLSLCQAFAARQYEPGFIINGDQSIRSIVADKKFILLNWIKEEKELLHALENIDVAIVDSYLAGAGVYKRISETVPVPVFLDDYQRLAYPPGIVVNWNIHARDLDYPRNNSVTYLLGPEYIALREAFREVREKKINKRVTQVMITFGGDDSKNLTPMILRFLTRHYPGLKKHVVLGSAFTNGHEIAAAADNNTDLLSSPDDAGMKEIMLKSDIAVASGGQTLYELARVGVPTVAIAVADNQRGNVNGWEKAGFIENAGFWTDSDLEEKLADRFKRLMDLERRLQAVETGRLQVPGNGADKIVDFVLESLPPAALPGAKLLKKFDQNV
jgi:UDP-2,4-diacetamido-2,4,6-trideoxy-beta-L-altropyranose hydrolase